MHVQNYNKINSNKLKVTCIRIILFALALILSITSLTTLIAPKAGATSLPNVVADPTFNVGGAGFSSLSASNTAQCSSAIAVQSDSKILVGGGFTEYNGQTKNKIARLNSDGTVDNSFNVGGSGFDTGVASFISNITIQPDGKIVAVGNFQSYNGISQ